MQNYVSDDISSSIVYAVMKREATDYHSATGGNNGRYIGELSSDNNWISQASSEAGGSRGFRVTRKRVSESNSQRGG